MDMPNILTGSQGDESYKAENAILLADPEKRKQAEDEQSRKEHEKHLLALQQQQASAQTLQAKANVTITRLTLALVFTAIAGLAISYFQFEAADKSAKAALAASNATMKQLEVAEEANRLTDQANQLARMNSESSDALSHQTLEQTKLSNRINRESLISVQRAFVSFANPEFNPVIDNATTTDWEFRATLSNTGTTPTKSLRQHANWLLLTGTLPNDFDFRDVGASKAIASFSVLKSQQTDPLFHFRSQPCEAFSLIRYRFISGGGYVSRCICRNTTAREYVLH